MIIVFAVIHMFFFMELTAYAFEPSKLDLGYTSDSSNSSTDNDSEDEQPVAERLLNTDWCQCGQCTTMSSITECICCVEITHLQHKIQRITCVTENPSFNTVCINQDVLEVALLLMRDIRGESLLRPIDSRLSTKYTIIYLHLTSISWQNAIFLCRHENTCK